MGPVGIQLVGCKEVAQLYVPTGLNLMQRVEMMARTANHPGPFRLSLPITGAYVVNWNLLEAPIGNAINATSWLIGPDGSVFNAADIWYMPHNIIEYYLVHGIFRPVSAAEDPGHYTPLPAVRARFASVDIAFPYGIAYSFPLVVVEFPPLRLLDKLIMEPDEGGYIEATITRGMKQLLIKAAAPKLFGHLGYFPGPIE